MHAAILLVCYIRICFDARFTYTVAARRSACVCMCMKTSQRTWTCGIRESFVCCSMTAGSLALCFIRCERYLCSRFARQHWYRYTYSMQKHTFSFVHADASIHSHKRTRAREREISPWTFRTAIRSTSETRVNFCVRYRRQSGGDGARVAAVGCS